MIVFVFVFVIVIVIVIFIHYYSMLIIPQSLLRYLPPEFFPLDASSENPEALNTLYNTAVDVYCFGLLLLEIFTKYVRVDCWFSRVGAFANVTGRGWGSIDFVLVRLIVSEYRLSRR